MPPRNLLLGNGKRRKRRKKKRKKEDETVAHVDFAFEHSICIDKARAQAIENVSWSQRFLQHEVPHLNQSDGGERIPLGTSLRDLSLLPTLSSPNPARVPTLRTTLCPSLSTFVCVYITVSPISLIVSSAANTKALPIPLLAPSPRRRPINTVYPLALSVCNSPHQTYRHLQRHSAIPTKFDPTLAAINTLSVAFCTPSNNPAYTRSDCAFANLFLAKKS